MFTLVVGGAASGKSQWAEELILKSGQDSRFYVATMQVFDDEDRARVDKHRAMRAGYGFETVECPTGLERVCLPARGAVLLECLSNLAANELYASDGAGDGALNAILQGVDRLLEQSETLVAVTCDVFSGGNDYAGDTETYLHLLADVNRALAARADDVCEVVCGVPCYYKKGGRLL